MNKKLLLICIAVLLPGCIYSPGTWGSRNHRIDRNGIWNGVPVPKAASQPLYYPFSNTPLPGIPEKCQKWVENVGALDACMIGHQLLLEDAQSIIEKQAFIDGYGGPPPPSDRPRNNRRY